MGLTLSQRHAVTKTIATRYKRSNRTEKGTILDELCATTGWHHNQPSWTRPWRVEPLWQEQVGPIQGAPLGDSFGATMEAEHTHAGITIPSAFRVGPWCTNRQAEGEFFRARITSVSSDNALRQDCTHVDD